MSRKDFPSRPRVVSGNLHKYVSRYVTIIGEVVAVTPAAGTISINMPDSTRMIVLLPKNNATTVENNLLTEVYGTLVSKGQVEAMWIKQYTQKETAMFNKSLYQEAGDFLEAHRSYYDV